LHRGEGVLHERRHAPPVKDCRAFLRRGEDGAVGVVDADHRVHEPVRVQLRKTRPQRITYRRRRAPSLLVSMTKPRCKTLLIPCAPRRSTSWAIRWALLRPGRGLGASGSASSGQTSERLAAEVLKHSSGKSAAGAVEKPK